jgi:post-segregation antitoxin (ccd killing protein)
MKLVLLTLTALLSFGSLKTKAQDIHVSAAVANAFNTSFKQASDVQWKDCGTFYKADFVMNGQYVTAFYDANAALLAVTKNISPLQLPVTLQANLKKSYGNYWISEAMEYSNEGGTSYYVTIENGESRITLKSFGTAWTTYKKQDKS